MPAEHNVNVSVLTPEGEVFSGEVQQLSTRTAVGDGEVRRWAQAEGWLQVFANRATVLVGEAIPPENLDQGELRSRIEDAEARLRESEEGSGAYDLAERDKERAEAFLQVAESQS